MKTIFPKSMCQDEPRLIALDSVILILKLISKLIDHSSNQWIVRVVTSDGMEAASDRS